MKTLLIILIVYGFITTVTISCMLYEWFRYDSGFFKPKYHIAQCTKKIRQYENEINESFKNDNLQELTVCVDNLDYWKTELRRSIKYHRRHKLKWGKTH